MECRRFLLFSSLLLPIHNLLSDTETPITPPLSLQILPPPPRRYFINMDEASFPRPGPVSPKNVWTHREATSQNVVFIACLGESAALIRRLIGCGVIFSSFGTLYVQITEAAEIDFREDVLPLSLSLSLSLSLALFFLSLI